MATEALHSQYGLAHLFSHLAQRQTQTVDWLHSVSRTLLTAGHCYMGVIDCAFLAASCGIMVAVCAVLDLLQRLATAAWLRPTSKRFPDRLMLTLSLCRCGG